ncbi:hypothetical protein [Kaistia terrae]|uniref:Uncharacterized protein n=1 Tax=Kaistia terrae TaxID=537017 RepID=A0ABW0Q3X2_9HYPH|nr:hypothetical protein [Kaistia terrae]MCX5581461.1 hypothetical protein [Kaistia terrae]
MTRKSRLRTSIAVMIDAAGSARRSAADWQRMARQWPTSSAEYQATAARRVADARWYLHHARLDIDTLTGDAA